MAFDEECKQALDIAKAATSEGEVLTVELFMAALYNTSQNIKNRLPDVGGRLPVLEKKRDPAAIKVPLHEQIKPVMSDALTGNDVVTPQDLWERLCATPAGARLIDSTPGQSNGVSSWRLQPERKAAISALRSFGRVLTDTDLSQRAMTGKEREIAALIRTLSKMKRRNVLVVGHPGTGKSALVYELARRIRAGDSSLPLHLRDCDVFELSPAFLRSGASVVGQYDERVKKLLTELKKHPKILLFVDEIHSLFKSSIHHQGPFSDANESFKAELGRGEICVVGCTTLAEYRAFIQPDGALTRRFTVVTIQPPDDEETVAILRKKAGALQKYHHISIDDAHLRATISLTNEHQPCLYQPDKSIQLLDTACACAATADPPADSLGESHLVAALEEITGRKIAAAGALTETDVRDGLNRVLLGQEKVMAEIARAFVAGLGRFRKRSATRGVFLLAGPTGTGKTKAAETLATMLGDTALLRVDCNTLQGNDHDCGPAITRLIGVSKGYVGYTRGEGGVLSRVRDMPQSVVLFDEIEKAPAGIFSLLLQIIDDGRIDDADGNPLDFRRSFILFTTNAGVRRAANKPLGFAADKQDPSERLLVTKEGVFDGLRACGCTEEFLGRIGQVFVFSPLDRDIGRQIIGRGVEELGTMIAPFGLSLDVGPDVVDHLMATWNPRFGARHALTILKNRITEQLGVADAQGELAGVQTVRLMSYNGDLHDVPSGAFRRRIEDVLEIFVA